ncbi:hypothetical protein B0J12DRAFT_668332 [Macrophomina phaseolina]|uniref:Uncharacterized protein n=1 Tax=Macrophomina phaseolina TaxID=35725 RepID=A0ABQ8G744_9PEZI|nr:hypothetical protein B0J12DRAFT_668332 [Macrophomina phaseolina]
MPNDVRQMHSGATSNDYSTQINGDVLVCSLEVLFKLFKLLWQPLSAWMRQSLQPWFRRHPLRNSIIITFVILSLFAAIIAPKTYCTVQHSTANTTVVGWDGKLSTCTRHGATICPNDVCDSSSVCVAERTITLPCWDGRCCTEGCLYGWVCPADSTCAPGLTCRSRLEGSALISRCRWPETSTTSLAALTTPATATAMAGSTTAA